MEVIQSQVTKAPFVDFYKANSGLVHKVARKVHLRLLGMGAAVEMEDVVQEATIVMMRAYERFDPSLGFTFSTYFMRAAFYELNKFVEPYEKDLQVLGVFSMQAAVNEDGEELSGEGTIPGDHASPEQALECKQLLGSLRQKLSPLAYKILELLVEPPEQLMQEWQTQKELGFQTRKEMTALFVGEYVQRLEGDCPWLTIKNALSEINALERTMNV